MFLQRFFFKAFSSKRFLQSFSSLLKAFSSKLLFKAPSLKAFRSKRPPQSPFSQSLSLKAPSSKPLLQRPFLQSALLKALSFKTRRSKPLPSLQSVSPKAFSSKLLFTNLCNILSKTLFADLDILCSKQVRDTRQTIRQKCLHFDGNMIGIRKFVALRQLQ